MIALYLISNFHHDFVLQNKTLEAYRKDDLDTLGKTDTNLTDDVQQLMTFQEFNDCSIKNKVNITYSSDYIFKTCIADLFP